MVRILTALLVALTLASPAFGQSQAINGTIEGTIVDAQGGVLPGVSVTVTSIDTGDTRTVVTNESGFFRAPLLALGIYRLSAELQGFRTYEQTGITLTAGRTAVLYITLTVGAVQETITVSADSPFVDSSKIEQGRTITEAEIKTLPLTSRNPYNFALLQPGVVGFENQEFGVPRIQSNGALVRVNYQIDGSNNTQKDRAGLRQMPMSEDAAAVVRGLSLFYARTARRRAQTADRRQRPHGRSRRAHRSRQDAFLWRLRAYGARLVGHGGDHDHARESGASRPE
jgi:hypothetical protein